MQALERAALALDGLSVGDAFGQKFFMSDALLALVMIREPLQGPLQSLFS